MRKSLFLLTLTVTPLLALRAQAPNAADLGSRRTALNALLQEEWEHRLRENPTFASFLGDKRWNDKLDDFSQEAIDRRLADAQKFLDRFEAIDTTGFPEQEALNKTLMVRDLKVQLDGARFKDWEMPVDQQNGVQIWLPQLPIVLSFQTVKDYEDYISRLNQIPRFLDETMVQMKKGVNDQLMPPKFILGKVVEQSENLAKDAPEKSPFSQPFTKFPDAIPAAEQKRLRDAGLHAVQESVLPAYARFTKYVREEYAPHGRTEPGVWSLPNGAEYYSYLVRYSTTTSLTPEEIHNLGIAQVREIETRMNEVAVKLGYKDVRALRAAITADPKLHGQSRQQILDLYRKYIDQMTPRVPEMFGKLPKAKLEILPIEEFREKDAPFAQYQDPAQDGSRPGHVMVNTSDFSKRLLINVESTAYHEGVPGHHLQIALAQELPQLPPFRQHEYFTAYTEGWALYAERLGKEIGFYQDPYNYYGHLQEDMLRAIRLVVDTGVHYKHWTRQQMVDYFHAHSGEDEVSVQEETDRYIVWPGQALGYKIGQLEILKLRQYAKDQVGDKFDLRAFHDEVLGGGALPMDVLDERVREWVTKQKGQQAGKMSDESQVSGAGALN
jgi:uncharacterized protein (DUF885 family)